MTSQETDTKPKEQRIAKIKAALCRVPYPRVFAPADVAFLLDQLAAIPAQIEAAVQAERECFLAVVAENRERGVAYWGVHTRETASSAVSAVCAAIDAAIRSRGETVK